MLKIDSYNSGHEGVLRGLAFDIPNAFVASLTSESLSFSLEINSLGFCFVECLIFHNLNQEEAAKQMFFHIKILPRNSRHKFYRVTLSDCDLMGLVSCDPKKVY